MTLVRSANVIEGLGIEGDKHASAASKRQVLLADKEALDAVGVLPGTIKENVTVEGVDVMQLADEFLEVFAGIEGPTLRFERARVDPHEEYFPV